MTMQNPAHRDPLWLRALNATVRVVITAQVAFLLFVVGAALAIGVGIIGLATSR
jgi:hypothetical protein